MPSQPSRVQIITQRIIEIMADGMCFTIFIAPPFQIRTQTTTDYETRGIACR